MFRKFILIITCILVFILLNINSYSQSDLTVWTTINKTVIPDMIQLSNDGNFLHAIQGNYYKKIDLKLNSIVSVVDLKRIYINAIVTMPDYFNMVNNIKVSVININYPIIYFEDRNGFIIRTNIETSETNMINIGGFSYLKSNKNYCLFCKLNYNNSAKLFNVYLWDHKKNINRLIFKNCFAAGFTNNYEYWIYTKDYKIQVFNVENDSLLREGDFNLKSDFNFNTKQIGDEIYFFTLEGKTIGMNLKFNTHTMKSENHIPQLIPVLNSNPDFNMKYENYIGYTTNDYEPKLVIYDIQNNFIKTNLTDTNNIVAYDIDTIKSVLYYVTKSFPNKIFCKNINNYNTDKIFEFDLQIENFKIGKELLTHSYFISQPNFNHGKSIHKFTFKNIDNGKDIRNVYLDENEIDYSYCAFFYDSTTNDYFPYFRDSFSGCMYDFKDYEVICGLNNTILPFYSTPFGLFFKLDYIYTFDLHRLKAIDSVYFESHYFSAKGINREGSQIMFYSNYYDNFIYFYDVNEKYLYKYNIENPSWMGTGIIGNKGRFLSIINRKLFLNNFKNQNENIEFGSFDKQMTSFTYTINERTIITGDIMGKISFWNVLTKSKYYELDLKIEIKKIDLTFDEKNLIVLTGDGSLSMFDITDILKTDVKDNENKADFKVFPNPAANYIDLSLTELQSSPNINSDIKIYNSFGEIIVPIENNGSSLKRIDISMLPMGLYFVKIGNQIQKFVKL